MSEGLIALLRTASGPVTWVLIHSVWLGGLIAIVLAVTLNLLRDRSPHFRYVIACLGLLLIMPMSISLVAYDTFSKSLVPHSSPGHISTTSAIPSKAASAARNDSAVPAQTDSYGGIVRTITAPWILLAWLFGVLALSVYHLTGWWHSRRVVRLNSKPAPPLWNQRFRRLCGRIGITRTIDLLTSTVTRMPCVVGYVKPAVLLPVSLFSGLDADEIEMILAHELAHVRRYDVLVNYVQTALETLLFFNPAVWWISRQVRVEREHCCDDFAVDICGDRVAYARALANLEGLRIRQPRLAPAANGTPLLKRVRRLVESAGYSRRRPGLNAVSIVTLLAVLTIGFSISTAFTPQNAPVPPTSSVANYEKQDDDIHGYWEIEPNHGRILLTMRLDVRGGRTTSTYYEEDFVGLREGSNIQFQMIRDAGTFFFEGDIESDDGEYWGEGECHFRPNSEYIEKMAELGHRIRSDRDIWTLVIHNVQLAFAEGIHDAGYERISLDRLIELHIHRVTPEFIAELAELGYHDLPLQRLIEMRIHKATPEYIRELAKAGYTDLEPSELVEMKIHRVDPDYIQAFSDLGYRDLRVSKLVEMSIHRVTPRVVKELKELGYDNLDPSKLVEMQIHRVDPDYIRDLAGLGLKDIKTSDLVAMRIHDVSRYYIESLIEQGYDDLEPDDLVSMRIHDVTAEFIEEMKDRGYDDLSADDLIEMKIHGFDRHRRTRYDNH
ncbi:MAG: M56 family metallopeptidase [Candidatus Zixiibacteriota bacterium]|nr:MAG: M56 family metallopeptidase [candidate division Zixibacteria bacterium]